MHKTFILLALIGLALPAQSAESASDDTADRMAIVSAWENVQRNDPKTASFEKTGSDTYRLKTTRFPYDGTVRIANVVVRRFDNDMPDTIDGTATIEPVLDTNNRSLIEQYPASFPEWLSQNRFYHAVGTMRWFSEREWQKRARPTAVANPEASAWRKINFLMLLVVSIVLLVVGLVFQRFREARMVRKSLAEASDARQETTERHEEARQRTLEAVARQAKLIELNEEQTRLLRELVEMAKQREAGH